MEWEVGLPAATRASARGRVPSRRPGRSSPAQRAGKAGDAVPNPSAQARIQEVLLTLDSRRRIYERIQAVPGIHMRRLARESRVAIGTLEHHVRMLERHGLVRCHKEGTRRAYFAVQAVDEADVRGLFLLRNRKWRPILLELLSRPGQTFEQLHVRLALNGSTLAYHLRRLCEHGALERTSIGRSSLYHLKDPDRLKRLFATYAKTFRPLGPLQSPPAPGPLEFLLARLPPPEPRPTPPAPVYPGPRILEA
jgi:DNA-binding MarR family transcriptional regulator